jgi:hypothetical protein
MTKKDYERIAFQLNCALDEASKAYVSAGVREVVTNSMIIFIDAIATTFSEDNPRFKKDLFIKRVLGE